MEFMPTPAGQATGFIYSAGLGFCLGFVYDFFRMFFYLLTGSDKKLSVIRDIIYLLVLTAVDFIFSLVMCSGRMMLYIFVGEAIGLFVYFRLLSSLYFHNFKRFIKGIRTVIINIWRFFRAKTTEICILLHRSEKNSKKSEKNSQKGLKIRHGLLYNLSVKLFPKGRRLILNRGDERGKNKEA